MARSDYYGLDLNWYAIDSGGRVGQFTAGYAPIPAAVFTDEALLQIAGAFFERNAERTTSSLSDEAVRMRRLDRADFSISLAEARTGVFVFGETGKQGAATYALEAIPAEPVLVHELPLEVRRAVSLVQFPAVSFPDVRVIEPGKFVPCAV